MVSTEITPGRGDFDRDLVGEIVSATSTVATIDPIDMLISLSLVGVAVIGRRVGDLVGTCLVGMEVGVKIISITPMDMLISLLLIGNPVGE